MRTNEYESEHEKHDENMGVVQSYIFEMAGFMGAPARDKIVGHLKAASNHSWAVNQGSASSCRA